MASPSLPSSNSCVELETDLTRKILRLRYYGVVTAQGLHAQVQPVREAVARMGAGFTLVTDLTELQEMEIDTVGEITRIMDLCVAAGIKQVVRVIPDPEKDIGFHLLSLTHYRGRVPVATFETAAEAQRALGGPQS